MQNILSFSRQEQERWLYQPALQAALADRYGFALRVVDSSIDARDVDELFAFWQPVGCIVNNDRLPSELFADYPTIFCHRVPEKSRARHASIAFDEKAVSEAAAHELLSLDLAGYAFVPSPMNENWCRERERHFAHLLSLNGFGLAVFGYPLRQYASIRLQVRLADWLAALPKPVGVFAANDAVAAQVLSACALRKLSVPDDVSVIGVDNMESICETVRPTLSSVAPDIHAYRDASYRLLTQLIAGQGPNPRLVTVKPLGVVRRASSLRFRKVDPAVRAACELIRLKACEGLKARDVAVTFPCGRRMAEIRFRAALGHSILDEIRAIRRAKARESLSTLRLHTRDEIAASCGYSSWSSIHRLFEAD